MKKTGLHGTIIVIFLGAPMEQEKATRTALNSAAQWRGFYGFVNSTSDELFKADFVPNL